MYLVFVLAKGYVQYSDWQLQWVCSRVEPLCVLPGPSIQVVPPYQDLQHTTCISQVQ